MFKIKNIFIIILLSLSALVGWKIYNFFFDTNIPSIQLTGLNNGEHYCADIQCSASIDKKSEISAWLDNKPILSNFKILADQKHPFTIPTRTVSNGKHKIKIVCTDNTFRKNTDTLERTFYVDNTPLQAAFIQSEIHYKVLQGRTLHLQFQVNKKISKAKACALSSEYPCFPETKNSSIYEAFIPIPCEETPNEYLLTVDIKDNVGNIVNLENKFQIVPYPFKKQRLTFNAQKLKKEKELGKPAHELDQKIAEILEQSPQKKLWRGSFCVPIDSAQTTCHFGTIRTTQEKGKYQHKAIDMITNPKSVVWTTQTGTVALKERFEHSGNTVIIDHGWGIMSMYFHLDSFANIEIGQRISQGNPVGTLGKTGYATGYHLHWELRVNNIAVDPMQWTKQSF